MKKQQLTVAALLSAVYLAILLALPFHAFFTTWLGATFGAIDVWRVWKELLLLAILPAVVWLGFSSPRFMAWLRTAWLPRLVVGFMLLFVASGLIAWWQGTVTGEALAFALVANLRYLGFFLCTMLVALHIPAFSERTTKFVMYGAFVVCAFGILQITVLPHTFLTHFGYGPDTIPAFQTVDNKLDYQRVQSTLRGANPLGAYLVVIIALLAARIQSRRDWVLIGGLVGTLTTLFFTYSRSAYVGAAIALSIIVWLRLSSRLRRVMLVVSMLAVLVVGTGVYVLRDNDVVQNTLFHSDETSQSAESSNTGRANALESGWNDVRYEPLGRGPGSAGPESFRNDSPARIAENYFLQIGQEVGWLGLTLYVLITVLIGIVLWGERHTRLGLAIFASGVGLVFVNMVSHAWSDDTLGMLWWGLAGIVVGSAIIRPSLQTEHHETAHQKKTAKRN